MGRLRHLPLLAGLVCLNVLAIRPALGQTVEVTVSGQANPYLAGSPPGTRCCFGLDEDVVPNQSPVQVPGLSLAPGAILTFGVSGSVSHLAGTPPTDPPDGGDLLQVTPRELRDGVLEWAASSHGMSGTIAPINALLGVFLDDSSPTSSPAPAVLDFSPGGLATGFHALCPALKQVFYIGDGLSGNGSGVAQRFVIPAGATRLFLGTVDGHGWSTNSGSLSARVTTGPPASAFAEINGNGAAFQAEETLVLNVHACNPSGQDEALDLYVGALLPDGDTIAFLTEPNVVGGGKLSAPASLAPFSTLAGGSAITMRALEFTFPAEGIPIGTYVVFAAVVRQGALADNVLNDGDLVSLTFFPLEYAP